jgi:hypothetical protein
MDASSPEVQGRPIKRSRISHGEISVSRSIFDIICRVARLHVGSAMYSTRSDISDRKW